MSGRHSRQPSATANVELPEGGALVGPFGDYVRHLPDPAVQLDQELDGEWDRLQAMRRHPAGGVGRLPTQP